MVKFNTFRYAKRAQIPLGSVAELVDAPDLKSVERFSSWGFKSLHSHDFSSWSTMLEFNSYIWCIICKIFFCMENLLNNPFLTLGAYVLILTIYLAVVPLSLFYWMNNRWNVMGKFERLGIYGLVFLFFPGLILFSPFLNLRLNGENKG